LSLPSTRGPLRDLGSFPTRRASDLMDELRPHEAEALAGRLLAFAEKGVPFARMAVLARNRRQLAAAQATLGANGVPTVFSRRGLDRKSTRLNSSHVKISYAVFCLKK